MADTQPESCPALTEGKVEVLEPVEVTSAGILSKLLDLEAAQGRTNTAIAELNDTALNISAGTGAQPGEPGEEPTPGVSTYVQSVALSLPYVSKTYLAQHDVASMTVSDNPGKMFEALSSTLIHKVQYWCNPGSSNWEFTFTCGSSTPPHFYDEGYTRPVLTFPDGTIKWTNMVPLYQCRQKSPALELNVELRRGEVFWFIVENEPTITGLFQAVLTVIPNWHRYRDKVIS